MKDITGTGWAKSNSVIKEQTALTRALFLQIAVLYLVSWIIVYLNLPTPLRLIFGLGLIVLQFRSFYIASVIMFAFLFVPYFYDIMNLPVSGLNSSRLMFLPYLYIGFSTKPVRSFKINKYVFFFVVLSIGSIMISAELRKMFQDLPASESASPGLLNFIARSADIIFNLLFFYLIGTRLSKKQLDSFLDILILLAALQALSIIFLVAKNPQSLIKSESFDKSYLWKNPYFGHKNDWGMVMSFMVLVTYIRSIYIKSRKTLYVFAIAFLVLACLFSLSRQAYACMILGFFIISLLQGNLKPAIAFGFLLILIISLQPAFLMSRIDSLLNISNLEDFQQVSRKVGSLAFNQFISNLTIVPNIFVKSYEYNWSEGFWNGLAHQQGIIGILFHISLYFFFIWRYFLISKVRFRELSLLGILMSTFSLIIFLSNYNRRGIHFMHYEGKIQQFGLMLLFLVFFTEFWISYFKNLSNNHHGVSRLQVGKTK